MQFNVFSSLVSKFQAAGTAADTEVRAAQVAAPVELTVQEMTQVGGSGPAGTWAVATSAMGPAGTW